MSAVDHLLHQATRAADVLKEQLREIAGDDLEVIADTIEGEIDLHRLISWAAEENGRDTAQINGISDYIKRLKDLQDRIEKRVAMRRAAMLTAMQAGEIKRVDSPAGTITRKAVAPKVLILEEASIPAEFWKPSDPKLDLRAVGEALKAGKTVEGAMMSNGSETIQVRV